MTAQDIIKTAILLLGYNDDRGNISDARFLLIAMNAINAVYAELFYFCNNDGFKEISSPNEDIKLPERALYNIMPYGVASFIARSSGDADNQAFFGAMYNQRKAQLSYYEDIADEIPYPEY